MSYRENYENWLNSPVLSQEEKAELEAIRGDEKEICLLYTSPSPRD